MKKRLVEKIKSNLSLLEFLFYLDKGNLVYLNISERKISLLYLLVGYFMGCLVYIEKMLLC